MGSSVSRAAASAPPAAKENEAKTADTVDYPNLPCPVPYEEVQREASISLNPKLFEGMRFDFRKDLNEKLSLSYSLFINRRTLQLSNEPRIYRRENWEFGLNFIDPKFMLFGRIDDCLKAWAKIDLTDKLILRINAQIEDSLRHPQGNFSFDYKGKDYRTQFRMGSSSFYNLKYIQSVTPNLSLGTDFFWVDRQMKPGIGFAARYNTDKMVAAGEVTRFGTVSLSYVHKVSEKVSLASDFIYEAFSKVAIASVGYNYMLRQCHFRGKIDSKGVVAVFVKQPLIEDVVFILSAELDYVKKDYKLGIGLTGEF